MWMMERMAREDIREPAAELGQVTVGDGGAAVALAGERRNVILCLPGGYHWTPRRGDTVLVVKSGPDQAPCIVGGQQDAQDLAAGEVFLSVADGAGIRLRRDGRVELTGQVTVNGREV